MTKSEAKHLKRMIEHNKTEIGFIDRDSINKHVYLIDGVKIFNKDYDKSYIYYHCDVGDENYYLRMVSIYDINWTDLRLFDEIDKLKHPMREEELPIKTEPPHIVRHNQGVLMRKIIDQEQEEIYNNIKGNENE